MCGIVGYTGRSEACPILLDGLQRLEYRGYDSAGVAVGADNGKLEVVKVKGRLEALREMTDSGRAVHGRYGIGHTRWATHGEPTAANAHPHVSKDSRVAVVHNGIIENFQELRQSLERHGVVFASQTDTECVAHLIDRYYQGDAVEAIARALARVRGSYALGILFRDEPGVIWAIRKDSPMIVGQGEDGSFIASDVPAILKHTRRVCYVQNMELVRLEGTDIRFYSLDGEELKKEFTTVEWDADAAEKGGYAHFMLKEIHEQPKAVTDTISPRIRDGRINLEELGLSDDDIRGIRRIQMTACGSAYHVCMTARYVFESLARIPVDVDLASELRYRNPVLEEGTLLVVVSQSGETADSLAALRYAKEKGIRTLAIVNVVGSSIAREADMVLYTWAGPEIAVATTKAYSTQLVACDLLALHFGLVRGALAEADYQAHVRELQELPRKIERLLEEKERVQWFAGKLAARQSVFFIGRGLDYASSLEGSLKLKEISYIHSEAYAAGELKHGTISLIENGTMVVGIATQADLIEKEISNMVEVRSRGAYVLGLTSYGHYAIEDHDDFTIYVPKTCEAFYPSLTVIPLQLLAYYVSLAKGLDVDKPRNLAKSVTVE
ncbi:MAG: glutamine--fructose-6-phosphate transaminase (isomerizing) [Clostridia bacterium]|nr:glutamine--fructose-6-phosphate transaminase (isomerizing) [Clostridia bacterium]